MGKAEAPVRTERSFNQTVTVDLTRTRVELISDLSHRPVLPIEEQWREASGRTRDRCQ